MDGPIAFGLGSSFGGPAPNNNDMDAQLDNGSYGWADAQVSTTGLSQAFIGAPVVATGQPTQAWQIAEGYIPDTGFATDGEKATAMLQNSIIFAFNHPRFKASRPTIAYIDEGPYAIPMGVK